MTKLQKIKELYNKGENLIAWLKESEGRTTNSFEDIMISYDFQAGTYVQEFEKNKNKQEYMEYYVKIAEVISNYLREFNTANLFEAGVGEATTLGPILERLPMEKLGGVYGLDASFSRLKEGKQFLDNHFKFKDVKLIMGDMLNMPIADNSCDIVYTVHACEPNGGNEEKIIKELLRVTGRYLILFEPAYDLADEEAKRRMEKHGYVTRLYDVITEMKLDVVEHHLLGISRNELNPTGVTVIRKHNSKINKTSVIADPVSKKICAEYDNCFWSEETMLLYPKIDGIACMLEENAIVATKYGEL